MCHSYEREEKITKQTDDATVTKVTVEKKYQEPQVKSIQYVEKPETVIQETEEVTTSDY